MSCFVSFVNNDKLSATWSWIVHLWRPKGVRALCTRHLCNLIVVARAGVARGGDTRPMHRPYRMATYGPPPSSHTEPLSHWVLSVNRLRNLLGVLQPFVGLSAILLWAFFVSLTHSRACVPRKLTLSIVLLWCYDPLGLLLLLVPRHRTTAVVRGQPRIGCLSTLLWFLLFMQFSDIWHLPFGRGRSFQRGNHC